MLGYIVADSFVSPKPRMPLAPRLSPQIGRQRVGRRVQQTAQGVVGSERLGELEARFVQWTGCSHCTMQGFE